MPPSPPGGGWCCRARWRLLQPTLCRLNLHPAKGRRGVLYFYADPLHPPAHSTCLCLFWIKVPVWWSIFTLNLLMLAAPHKPTRGGRLAWSEFKMHYYFILLDFSDQRTCWSGRMNVNGPCLLSLQQFQIIEVAFPMYAYYTKAPLWIREREKKLVKWLWRQQTFLCTLSGMGRCQLKMLLWGKKRGFLFESREKWERCWKVFGEESFW